MMHVAKLHNDADVQAFEYFHHHTLPMLRLCHPSVLWRHMLGYSVQIDSLLRTIALAVGSQQRLTDTGIGDTTRNEALYGRAIHSVRNALMNTSIDDVAAIALACAFLIMLESLRGSSEDMLVHLRSGVRIVVETFPFTGPNCIDELQEVKILLQQYCVSSWMFCTSPGYRGRLALHLQSIEFDKMTHLRSHESESLSHRLHNLISKTIFAVRKFMNPKTTPLERFQVLMDFYRFKGEVGDLEGLLSTHQSSSITGMIPPNILFLWAKSINTHLFLKAMLGEKDEAHETKRLSTVLDILQSALTQLSVYAGDERRSSHTSTFSIGTGAIQILETVSAVSMDPAMQRRAFDLLSLCPSREGLWNAEQTMSSLSERPTLSEIFTRSQKRFVATNADDRLASTVDVAPVITIMLEDLQLGELSNASA